MIELFFAPSPNVYKVAIALEEVRESYTMIPVDMATRQQFQPDKLGGAVTTKVPVIVDHDPAGGGTPVSVFESGAILLYLSEKHHMLLATQPRERMETLQWLFWQMSGLGPFGGQCFHFRALAPRVAPNVDHGYSAQRYEKIMAAHWNVMEQRLAEHDFLTGRYSIADIACYPWIDYLAPQDGRENYPNIARWHAAIRARDAVTLAYQRCFSVDMGYPRNELGQVIYPSESLNQVIIW